MKKTMPVLAATALFGMALAGCSLGESVAPKRDVTRTSAALQGSVRPAGSLQAAGSVKGSGGQMPAYYDGKLVTINTLEISDVAGEHVVANPSHNEIYVTNDLDEEQDFNPVIDAIQGDGFNPLWEQFLIVFNPGVTPHQFFSDEEVDEAASGPNPEITLVDTHEMYRCSVVGAK
jgi:hypothetical protein